MNMKERWEQRAKEIQECSSLPELVIEFFNILDTKESNDDGSKTFNPVTISSVRVYSTYQLEHILPRMKELAYKQLQADQMREWDL